MDKIEIYHYLKRQNIAYEITEHKAVFNMEEADAVDLPYPEWGAKNLFVRDDKKRNYYLITMKGNKASRFESVSQATWSACTFLLQLRRNYLIL